MIHARLGLGPRIGQSKPDEALLSDTHDVLKNGLPLIVGRRQRSTQSHVREGEREGGREGVKEREVRERERETERQSERELER